MGRKNKPTSRQVILISDVSFIKRFSSRINIFIMKYQIFLLGQNVLNSVYSSSKVCKFDQLEFELITNENPLLIFQLCYACILFPIPLTVEILELFMM